MAGLDSVRFRSEFTPPKVNDIHFNLTINDCEPTVVHNQRKVIWLKKSENRRNINIETTIQKDDFLVQAESAKFQTRKPKTQKFDAQQSIKDQKKLRTSMHLNKGEIKKRSKTVLLEANSKIHSADLQNIINQSETFS